MSKEFISVTICDIKELPIQVGTLGGIIYIQRDPSTFESELKAINS